MQRHPTPASKTAHASKAAHASKHHVKERLYAPGVVGFSGSASAATGMHYATLAVCLQGRQVGLLGNGNPFTLAGALCVCCCFGALTHKLLTAVVCQWLAITRFFLHLETMPSRRYNGCKGC
jgi:hypothetical protein